MRTCTCYRRVSLSLQFRAPQAPQTPLSGPLTSHTTVIKSGYDNDAVTNTVPRCTGLSSAAAVNTGLQNTAVTDAGLAETAAAITGLGTYTQTREHSPVTSVTHVAFTFPRTTLPPAHTIIKQSWLPRLRHLLTMLSHTPDPPLVTYP